jgi:DNA-binding SARP family transcriptional activator
VVAPAQEDAMSWNKFTMRLFGGFELRRGDALLDLPHSVQRLLSFLALNERSLPRRHVADTLWPDAEEDRAQANLRTTLWRIHTQRLDLLNVTATDLALSPAVWVDVRTLVEASREHRRTGILPHPDTLLGLRGELLPGRWDSWLVFDRERLRLEAIHLLESACDSCMDRGDSHLATLLGLCAVEYDPLRESANLRVVRAHLARGDTVLAIRHARRYTELLADELGVAPPIEFEELLWQHRRKRGNGPVDASSSGVVVAS